MKSESFFKAGSYIMFFSGIFLLIFGVRNVCGVNSSLQEVNSGVNSGVNYEEAFGLAYILLLMFVGFLNIRLVRSGIPITLLKIVYWWNFIMFGLILLVMIYFQIIPTIISHSIIALCFLLTILGKDEY